MSTVTVFGSSLPREGDEEYEDGYKLGKLLGHSGLSLCTGGYQGIMDAVSKGASEERVEVYGITVDIFNASPSKFLTKEIEAPTLQNRLEKLVEFGDAYIVLPGGTGTLLELSLVWEYFNKGLINSKPFATVGEMWKPVVREMEKRITYEQRRTGLLKSFDTVEECAEYVINSL